MLIGQLEWTNSECRRWGELARGGVKEDFLGIRSISWVSLGGKGGGRIREHGRSVVIIGKWGVGEVCVCLAGKCFKCRVGGIF